MYRVGPDVADVDDPVLDRAASGDPVAEGNLHAGGFLGQPAGRRLEHEMIVLNPEDGAGIVVQSLLDSADDPGEALVASDEGGQLKADVLHEAELAADHGVVERDAELRGQDFSVWTSCASKALVCALCVFNTPSTFPRKTIGTSSSEPNA